MTTQLIDESVETALLERVKAGDKESFIELIRPYTRNVYLAAYTILRNPQDAEEVAQETFMKALRSIGGFRGDSRFKSWLITIALNEARMKYRRDRKALMESLDEEPEIDHEDYHPREFADWREIPSEALERKEVQAALDKALAQLPETFREVLVLRDVQHLSIAETAEALKISEALVKTRLYRARLRMRDLLAGIRRHQIGGGWFKKGKNPW
jgi:RNA polymerase sigma-70 factor, ECF subfamily